MNWEFIWLGDMISGIEGCECTVNARTIFWWVMFLDVMFEKSIL